MSKTISIRLNRDQIDNVCANFDIKESELGSITKEILINPKILVKKIDPKFYQKLTDHERKKNPKDIDDVPVSEIEEKSKTMTTEEIRKMLNNGKAKENTIDKNGLYGAENLEAYLDKFKRHWGRDISKIPELAYRVNLIFKMEILSTEYTRRSI